MATSMDNPQGSPSAEPWRPPGSPILEGLIKHVPESSSRFPWRPGYELHIRGQGSLVSKERRRYTIVGRGGRYSSYVGGHRNLDAEYQKVLVSGNRQITVKRPDDTGGLEAEWGLDELTVKGDASWTFHSRVLMMGGGTVERNWSGGVMRLSSMEGVICGGALVRAIGGPSATMAALMSGDIYGGCARVSGVRTYLAVLHYRAAERAAWALGIYSRTAQFVIEPLVIMQAPPTKMGNVAAKVMRIGRVMSVARMLCPAVDILAGLAILAYTLGHAAYMKVRKPIVVPPIPVPRIRKQNFGVNVQAYSSITHF